MHDDDEREPELLELDALRYLARRLGPRRMAALRAELAAKPLCGARGGGTLLRLTEAIDLPGGLSIEHVLPQDWAKNWPVLTDAEEDPTPEEIEEATLQRQAQVHRIGNLTLVTGPLNSSLSNAPWIVGDDASQHEKAPEDPGDPKPPKDKRSALREHSVLRLNERLVRNDAWAESQIDARSHDLSARILRVWPGPDSAFWD